MSAQVEAPVVDDGELSRPVLIATLAGVIAAMLMGALDQTIVGTAMPRVIADLHGFEHYASVTTMYMLSSTVVVPIAGKLSDIYGRKTFLLMGVSIFVLASILCGAATSMTQLVIFRGLQGIGGGFSQAMAFITVADLFPPAKRGRVSGLMGAVFGVASVVGPALGGFLTDGPGWRWCFWANIPVGIAAFLVLLFAFPNCKHQSERPSIDYLGALTLVLSAVPLLLALSWGGRDYPWSSPTILGLLAFGVTMAFVFARVERSAKAPIIPPSLFAHRVVASSAIAATLLGIAMFGTLMFIPLFIQAVIGTTATKSGSVMTPMMFAMIASSIASGQLLTRLGRYKAIAVVGASVVTLGMFLLSTMHVDTQYATVLAYMMVIGVGLGITMPVFNLAVQNAVDIRQVGVATASLQFLRSMGGSVGAASFGAVIANRYVTAFHAGLPATVVQSTPPEVLARFDNPQVLMNPAAAAKLAGSPLLLAVRNALATAVHTVFVGATFVAACAIVAALVMKDLPLRKSNRIGPAPVE